MIVRSRDKSLIIWNLGNLKEDCDYLSISMGAFDFLILILRIFGFKCVRLWVGTDVYKCKFRDYRVRAKLLSYFCENITVAPWLTEELKEYGIKAKTELHNECVGILSKI